MGRLILTKRFFILALSILSLVQCSLKTKSTSPSKSVANDKNKEKGRFLLPKLIPHPDTCYLIEFVADGYELLG